MNTHVRIPDGYLRTTKFTTPSIKSEIQRNALEAFEIAVCEKFDQFDRFCDIQCYLTSGCNWTGIIDEYEVGYYIQIEGTRCSFNAFVCGDSVIRKLSSKKLGNKLRSFSISGIEGLVSWMSAGH